MERTGIERESQRDYILIFEAQSQIQLKEVLSSEVDHELPAYKL